MICCDKKSGLSNAATFFEMIGLVPHWSTKVGNLFAVRVTPRAASNRISVDELEDGSLQVRVYITTVPENGKANQAVLKLLAKEMGVAKTSLTIVKGVTDRNKMVQVKC